MASAADLQKSCLANQGVKVLRGVYSRHGLDPKDELIATHGGRQALDSLLTGLER